MILDPNFWLNPWVSGIGTVLVSGLLVFLAKRYFFGEPAKTDAANQNTQSTVITNNIFPLGHTTQGTVAMDKPVTSLSDLKRDARVLFIDDQDYKKIKNLRKNGWTITRIKDVDDLDASEIRSAHVIFVDYKDIGMSLSDKEGLGVVQGLKRRYGSDKWIILYSAHPYTLDTYDQASADSYLAKNSTLLEIEQKIIDGVKHVLK